MPWSVVEGARWFLMYGYLDLNTAMIASPNRFKGMPSFTYQPKGVKKDRTYTIDYFLRFFPQAREYRHRRLQVVCHQPL